MGVMRFSQLIDRRVETESGEYLGRAFDLRAALSPDRLEVTGIVVARRGFLERLGIVQLRGLRSHSRIGGDVIPWEAVVSVRGRTIVVRDDEG
jgi:sporulation protein YlmC with PRC-barrel domain